MRSLRIRPPYTVLAYATSVVILIVVALVHEGPHKRLIYGGFAFLIASFGLVRGFWVSWLFLAALAAGDVIIGVYKWPDWPATWTIVINGLMLALLLTRPTRSYARRGRPRVLARLG